METLDQLTARQYGHLSRAQLRAVLSQHAIRRRLSRGSYLPVHRQVVRVASHPQTEFGRYAAAVLAVGSPVALDGRAAARAHGLTALRPVSPIDVVVPYRRVPRPRRGVRIHRVRNWERLAVTEANRLPVATLAATAGRLASQVGTALLTDIVQDMVRHGLELDDLAQHASGAGGRALREVVGALLISAKSQLERTLFPALVDAGLPEFRRNVPVHGAAGDVIEELDALFEKARVAVQLDGWAFHHDRRRFQRDRANRLAVEAGLVVLRFTHRDLTDRLPDVIEQIRTAVALGEAAAL